MRESTSEDIMTNDTKRESRDTIASLGNYAANVDDELDLKNIELEFPRPPTAQSRHGSSLSSPLSSPPGSPSRVGGSAAGRRPSLPMTPRARSPSAPLSSKPSSPLPSTSLRSSSPPSSPPYRARRALSLSPPPTPPPSYPLPAAPQPAAKAALKGVVPPPVPEKDLPSRPGTASSTASKANSRNSRNTAEGTKGTPLMYSLTEMMNAPPLLQPPRTKRTLTMSTARLSFASNASKQSKAIKYGSGKNARVELVPQPSDDPEDPLNWPTWRKELNLAALLMMVSLVGVMKTAFVSVNGVLSVNYATSYTAVAALTGVPLMISAFSGLASVMASKIIGRRPVYLLSTLLVLVGALWNVNVASSFAQCMAARVFQGLGWGAFDTLVLGSIHDTYFEHEHGIRIAIFYIVTVASTWGPPLLGGVASEGLLGFERQWQIIGAFLAVAILLMAFGAPETAFDRSTATLQSFGTGWSFRGTQYLRPRGTVNISLATVKSYLSKMKPHSFHGERHRVRALLRAPRAFVAPTTILLTLVSFLPYAVLWGLVSSLSLLFSPMPFMLSPGSTGALLTGPFLLATGVAAAFSLFALHNRASKFGTAWWARPFCPVVNMCAVGAGSALSLSGLVALGVYVSDHMARASSREHHASLFSFAPDAAAARGLSLPTVSFVLGLVAAGAGVLDVTVRPLIRRSTQFTSSNLAVAMRNSCDMDAGVGCWRALASGMFVIALPNAVWAWEGLRTACVAAGVAQVALAAAVAAVWWVWDERVRRMDGRVMGLVDLESVKRTGSFFDTD